MTKKLKIYDVVEVRPEKFLGKIIRPSFTGQIVKIDLKNPQFKKTVYTVKRDQDGKDVLVLEGAFI